MTKSGLSQADPRKYRRDVCRKRGHLSRNCPEITFRISLSEGAVITKKAQEEDGPPEPEVLVTTADPETLPDAAIRLVERRAVRANLKEEQDRLKQHEAEANEILCREKERRDRERKGQDHEVSEKEKKFLAEEAKKKDTKEKKKVLKDKKIVKDKKKAVKDEKEKEKPVAEEYSYYSTSEDPQAKAKPAPKADDGKRKAKAMPKLASKKARGRPKNRPPTPPSSSSSEPGDDEGEEEEDLMADDFPPECEESPSPSAESELFEAESAAPKQAVQAKRRPDSLPDPKQRPNDWLMTRLRWIA